MRSRVSMVLTGAACALAACAPAAFGWGELTVRDVRGGVTATCLRDVGDGRLQLLTPIARDRYAFDLLTPGPTGLTPAGEALLPNLGACPEPTAAGDVTVVAGSEIGDGRANTIRAVVSRAGTNQQLTLGRTEAYFGTVAVAASAHGDAIVGWPQLRDQDATRPMRRVVVRRLTATGELGPLEQLSPWKSSTRGRNDGLVAVGMDATGTATVAWTRPIPDRSRMRDLFDVEVASAAPGQPFSAAQTVARAVRSPETLLLTVSPSGRALLSFDGSQGVGVRERANAGGTFAPVSVPGLGPHTAAPTTALRDDGGAVLAWRDTRFSNGSVLADDSGVLVWTRAGSMLGGVGVLADDSGVLVSTRAPGENFRPARSVDVPPSSQSLWSSWAIFGSGDLPSDLQNHQLSAALGPDGRFSLAWAREPPTPFGDRPAVAKAAAGSLDGSLGPATVISCRCRAVNGITALIAGGEPAAAYTDNRSATRSFRRESSGDRGRLHLWTATRSPTHRRPPQLAVSAPRSQQLAWRDPLRVRVRCSSACDLRGTVTPTARKRSLRALGTASLAAGRATWLPLWPDVGETVPPAGSRHVRVSVRAYARNGQRPTVRRLRVAARRKPVRPLPLPLDARVRRDGRALIVTWRYPSRPANVTFEVGVRNSISYRSNMWRSSGEDGWDRYRAVLRPRRGARVRRVVLTVFQLEPPRTRKLVLSVP